MLWILLALALGCEPKTDDTHAEADTDTDGDTDGDTDADTDVTPPGDGVLLYVGDGGGGPSTDLYPEDVEAIFQQAGIDVLMSSSLPGGWQDDYGVLVLLNPTDALSSDLASGSTALLDRGGRLVIGFERSGWGNTSQLNGLLASVGSSMRTVSDESSGGRADLSVQDVGGLTAGVGSLATFYSASVDIGSAGALALGRDSSGVAVVGYEELGLGDLVVVADSSFFGYYLDEADNTRFIENFASLR
jgi:hypothetical protein